MKPTTTMEAFCDLPFCKLIINALGDVSMCCYQRDQLGNILDPSVSLMDIWNSPTAKEIRETTLKGNLHRVCKSWNNCPFVVKERDEREFEVHEDTEFPTYVEICLPETHCNIGGTSPTDKNPACIMCCRNFDLPDQPDVTDILCEKVKPITKYLRRLCVLGIAEPFWKDAIYDVLDKIDFYPYREQIRVEANTNVTCLFPKNTDKWLSTVHTSEVSFSMDAATASTYQKIRRIDGFDHLVDYVCYYTKTRDQYGGPEKHRATIYNNINIINVDEMERMVEMAVECEVDQITMLPTHDQNGRAPLGEMVLNKKNVHIFAKNAELAQKRADELGIYLLFPKPFDIVSPSATDLIQIDL